MGFEMPKMARAPIPRDSSLLLNGQDRNREKPKKLTTSTSKRADVG
jgi:hypothetical protein